MFFKHGLKVSYYVYCDSHLGSSTIIEMLTTRFDETVFSSGDMALFKCSPPFYTTSFQWIINGSSLENLNLSNVQAGVNRVEGTAALMFPNLPTAYNGTTIQCVANSSSRPAPLYSNIIQILIEGW